MPMLIQQLSDVKRNQMIDVLADSKWAIKHCRLVIEPYLHPFDQIGNEPMPSAPLLRLPALQQC
ncbi:MAG: hypothetical protein HC828_07235 [Blastochloris sp.]|nr:hypothetical protein [Blastochloris sp.]